MIPQKIVSFRQSLMRNNVVVILCLLLVLVCFVFNYLERREALRERLECAYYVYADGEVVPAHYAQRRDNIEIEIRHHLKMFVDCWYSLTQYDWERKAEAAGWLGGNSIRDLFIARRKAGFFNRFIQNNISQEAEIVEVRITPQQDGRYAFDLVVDICERLEEQVQRWRVLAAGTVEVTERSWPHNPHGLWIEPYLETKIMEVRDE